MRYEKPFETMENPAQGYRHLVDLLTGDYALLGYTDQVCDHIWNNSENAQL